MVPSVQTVIYQLPESMFVEYPSWPGMALKRLAQD